MCSNKDPVQPKINNKNFLNGWDEGKQGRNKEVYFLLKKKKDWQSVIYKKYIDFDGG